MTVHHAIWPEGLPDRAVHTTSWWRAHWVKLNLQLHYMLHIRSARRVRHALSDEGVPDPQVCEWRLREAGAIPPPGGWPDDMRVGGHGGQVIDVAVTTHSVV